MGQVYFVRHGQTIWNVETGFWRYRQIALTELDINRRLRQEKDLRTGN